MVLLQVSPFVDERSDGHNKLTNQTLLFCLIPRNQSPSVIEASPVIETKECLGFDSSSSQEMETDMMDDDASNSKLLCSLCY